MTLKSALEDLSEHTLKAISGLWAKLEYVARLRSGGRYQHWGLSRVHGEDQAQQALTETHHRLLSRLLRTPIARLADDIAKSSQQTGMEPGSYLDNLETRQKDLLPVNPEAGSERHLSSVLKALSGLVKARRRPTRPAS